MELDHDAREFYDLGIVTSPAITAWEASFDDGETYVAGEAVTGGSRWLVAGEDAALGTAVAVITGTLAPKVRATDNPEIVVRRAPLIRYRT